MLFQAVVIFLPILNFFKISCKRERSIESINSCVTEILFSKTLFEPRFSRQERLRQQSEVGSNFRSEVAFQFYLSSLVG